MAIPGVPGMHDAKKSWGTLPGSRTLPEIPNSEKAALEKVRLCLAVRRRHSHGIATNSGLRKKMGEASALMFLGFW